MGALALLRAAARRMAPPRMRLVEASWADPAATGQRPTFHLVECHSAGSARQAAPLLRERGWEVATRRLSGPAAVHARIEALRAASGHVVFTPAAPPPAATRPAPVR